MQEEVAVKIVIFKLSIVLPFPRKLYDAEDIESTRYLEHTHWSNVIKTESGWTPGGLRKDNRKDIEVVVYRRLFVLP